MKKKLSRIIALLMTALTMLTTVNAFALTEGNKYSYKERFIDAHYSTGRWETADGHVHDNQGQVALRNLSSGESVQL